MSNPPSPPLRTVDDLVAVFREHVAPNKLAYYQRMGLQIVVGKREGIWFEDALGKLPRRDDRWFHRAVLRKPYPYLLPPKIDRHG